MNIRNQVFAILLLACGLASAQILEPVSWSTSVRTLETAAARATPGEPAAGWEGATDLFIRPGHQFQSVDCLLTNFHLPRTTLMVLIAAFAGRELVARAYAEAIRERYRFLSYGDAMLLV